MEEKKQENKHIWFVVAGLMLGMFVSSMDNTVVATAMPTIVSQLGGLNQYVWVTSAYMAAELSGMPVFGKLSDMYGRKMFFVGGLLLFMFGSVLCGTAQNVTELIIYRAIQGVGGGALVPISFTILFDIFPPDLRGKMSGLFGAVFGVSSLAGPLLGAYITDHINWRWIFYINLPIGLLAFVFVAVYYKESLQHLRQSIDWLGAVTLVGAVVCLMFGLQLGGNKYPWHSAPVYSLFAGFVLLFIVFLIAERFPKEPIIQFGMFKDRLFASSILIGLLYFVGFITATLYVPMFVQGVFGGTATSSGLMLLPMTLGSVISASVGGSLSTKLSYKSIMVVSGIVFLGGLYAITTIHPGMAKWMLEVYMGILGFGIGFSFSVLNMSGLHNMETRQRGQANSTMAFVRELGMAVGITIFGTIQRGRMTSGLKSAFAGFPGAHSGQFSSDPRQLLSPAARSHMPAAILDKIVHVLSNSVVYTFAWALIPAGLAFLLTWFYMTNDRITTSKMYYQGAEPKKPVLE